MTRPPSTEFSRPSARFFFSMIVLAWHAGRLKAVAEVLANLSQAVGDTSARADIQAALDESLSSGHNTLLLAWLNVACRMACCAQNHPAGSQHAVRAWHRRQHRHCSGQRGRGCRSFPSIRPRQGSHGRWNQIRPPRRGFSYRPKSLKVDQAKVDRLMNLIGELVVSKNALPYLAEQSGIPIRRARTLA